VVFTDVVDHTYEKSVVDAAFSKQTVSEASSSSSVDAVLLWIDY
jgi:hypothetical protein